jgi:hypothetical protein
MKDASKENGKKKGFWAAIRESMTKTGGCCGSGGNCCGPAQPAVEKKQAEEKPSARTPGATGERRS